ncbi:uncharacterized protein [Dermacentor albipictus]|uniref:uncharacterized protein isoform X2 n=1 Tax=Dermacentor albipictus TaxID=60249 RepID=UPI0031FC1D3A
MEVPDVTGAAQPSVDGESGATHQAVQPPGADTWPAPYEPPPEGAFGYGRSQNSTPTMAPAMDANGSDAFAPQSHSTLLQDAGQSMSSSVSRPAPGCPPDDQQAPRRFYTGDIADAYDEACNFWSFLDQELEPKDIKVEPSSPSWPEADSTSCPPYGGAAGPYCSLNCSPATLEHQPTPVRYDEPRAPTVTADSAAMTSCCYYELQPPPPPPASTGSRDPMMCPSPSHWPMDLSLRLCTTEPYYHCPLPAPPPHRPRAAAGDWNQQQSPQFADGGATGLPQRGHGMRNSVSVLDDGLDAASSLYPNQQAWHGQEGMVPRLTSDVPEVPLSPTGAFLKRFPYVGPRDDTVATPHPPVPPPTPLPPTSSPHVASGSQVPDGARIYYRNGSPAEVRGQASNAAAQGRPNFQEPPSPPATMTTLLSAVQQKQQQQQASTAVPASCHQRPRSLFQGPPAFVQLQRSPRARPAPVATHTLVTLNARSSAAGTPSAAGCASRFAAAPTYYNALLQPLPAINQQQQQAAQATGEGHQQQQQQQQPPAPPQQQQQFRFPRSNLTLLLTPTVRHGGATSAAPGINLAAAAPGSILLHSPSGGQFRHPLAAAAGLVHVGRFQTAQASTSTSAMPDSATKPRRTAAERSHPAVNYALRSLKIGPFLLEAEDPELNLGYKFKIIFSKRRFMYEFESVPSSEDEGMRLSCVIVPFQSLQALRCEHDYILVEVHSRPVMFLGRRTSPSNKKGAASAASTSSLSDHLEHYPVHKVQLNTTDVVRIRHLLWQFNPRFHELMLRRMSDADTKLDEPLPPYGAPGRAAWRNELAKANKAARKTPVSRRRGMAGRNRAVAAAGHPVSAMLGGPGASSLVPFAGLPSSSSSAAASGAPSPTCACRVSCRVARCSCAKARTRCDPARCVCLACDNPLNLLEAVGIPLAEAQADPCLMQAVFQVSDLPWYLCQQVRLNCCPESVMVRECIPGPMPCPRCRHPAQYSWCANTLFHGSTNHCSVCVRCNLFAGQHCQACNSCYYYSGNDKNCPRCRRTRGMEIVQRQAVAATTVQLLSIQAFPEYQQTQAQQSEAPAMLQAIDAPPATVVLNDAQASQTATVVVEEPQESSNDAALEPEDIVPDVVPHVVRDVVPDVVPDVLHDVIVVPGGDDSFEKPAAADVIQAEDKAAVICGNSQPGDRDSAPPLVVDI